jgi:hypothetical protein
MKHEKPALGSIRFRNILYKNGAKKYAWVANKEITGLNHGPSIFSGVINAIILRKAE